MSCSSCCCVTPRKLLDGIRTRKRRRGRDAARLVSAAAAAEEEEEDVKEEEDVEEEEEESRNKMDVWALREQYRSSRERQKRRTQVLLFRTVSQELSDAVSVIPVPQGLTSSWEPQSCSPVVNFNPNLLTSDSWHVHLGLHRRSCQCVTSEIHPETTNTNSSSRCSSSSSESSSRDQKLSGDSTDSLSRSRETSSSTRDPTGDPDPAPACHSFNSPTRDLIPAPPEASKKRPSEDSEDDRADGSDSLTRSDESPAPVASVTRSPDGSAADVDDELKKEENVAARRDTRNRKSSVPALRFTRQMSCGGVGSSQNQNQNQNHYPFPQRKPPRISEAARRLGMYSSF